jgi:nucleotide-binding universal stress UspA family protein
MKNILVGVDFDEKTEVLIEKAQEIAKRFNAKLWLLHVVYSTFDSISSRSFRNSDRRSMGERVIAILPERIN